MSGHFSQDSAMNDVGDLPSTLLIVVLTMTLERQMRTSEDRGDGRRDLDFLVASP